MAHQNSHLFKSLPLLRFCIIQNLSYIDNYKVWKELSTAFLFHKAKTFAFQPTMKCLRKEKFLYFLWPSHQLVLTA